MERMDFEFRVAFTGICTFVPREDGDQLCVLLPDATGANADPQGPKEALDGDTLRFHKGFLEFDPRDVQGSGLPDRPFRSIWEVEPPGGRFHFTFDDGTTGTRKFEPPGTASVRTVSLADLVAPGDEALVEVADWALDPVNPHHPEDEDICVLSQVVFDRGVVSGEKASQVQWKLDGTLGKGLSHKKMYHDLVVSVAGVREAYLWFTPFGRGGQPQKVLTFIQSVKRESLRIANLCELNPLGWEGGEVQPDDDKDFKWHYEMLKDRDGIQAKLGANGELPHPKDFQPQVLPAAEAKRYRSSGGDNCYGTFVPPKAFSF